MMSCDGYFISYFIHYIQQTAAADKLPDYHRMNMMICDENQKRTEFFFEKKKFVLDFRILDFMLVDWMSWYDVA